MVEVGVRAPHSLFASGPRAIASFASAVEERGFDRVWVGDHAVSYTHLTLPTIYSV